LTQHEGCGGTVEKLLSAPALQFKGTGWYITDYARSGSRGADDAAKGDSKKESKTEGKGDSGSASTKDSSGSSTTSSTGSTSSDSK